MSAPPAELDLRWDRVGDLHRGRIVLAGDDQIAPVWPGLYTEYPADPLLNPVRPFGIHNGLGEMTLVWRCLIWAATEGMSRFAIPNWWRDDAVAALGLDREEVDLVDWEYEIAPYDVPLAESDVGFVPAASSYRIPAQADPWSDSQRHKAALLPIGSLPALTDVHLALVGDASSELTVWGLPDSMPTHLLTTLRRRDATPTMTETLSRGGVFADLSMTHDLVGDPKDILSFYGRADLPERLEPILARGRDAWAAYLGAVPRIGGLEDFAAAADELVDGILGRAQLRCDDLLPRMLDAASPEGRIILAEQIDAEPGERLHYLDAAAVAAYIAQRYAAGDLPEVERLLAVVEAAHVEGNAPVRQLATVGYLESLQGHVLRSGTDAAALIARLGPESRRAWNALDAFWAGA